MFKLVKVKKKKSIIYKKVANKQKTRREFKIQTYGIFSDFEKKNINNNLLSNLEIIEFNSSAFKKKCITYLMSLITRIALINRVKNNIRIIGSTQRLKIQSKKPLTKKRT